MAAILNPSTINKETEVMKITTIVMAAAFAISSGCAFAAGSGAGEVAAGRAVGTANGSDGARGGGAAAPGGVSITTPNITSGMGTGGLLLRA
jgi:hypothetical protein